MTHGGLLDRGIGAALINALSTTHGLANTRRCSNQHRQGWLWMSMVASISELNNWWCPVVGVLKSIKKTL